MLEEDCIESILCHLNCSEEAGTKENPKEPSQINTVDAEGFLFSTLSSLFKVYFTRCFCIVVVEKGHFSDLSK